MRPAELLTAAGVEQELDLSAAQHQQVEQVQVELDGMISWRSSVRRHEDVARQLLFGADAADRARAAEAVAGSGWERCRC